MNSGLGWIRSARIRQKEWLPRRQRHARATLTLILSPVTQAKATVETEARESNAGTACVTQTETMVEASAHESNTGTTSVTRNSERTTKGKFVNRL